MNSIHLPEYFYQYSGKKTAALQFWDKDRQLERGSENLWIGYRMVTKLPAT